MRRERLVYTAKADGRVVVVHPSAQCMAWMGTGGRWNGERRGFLDEQIDRQIAAGHQPDAVRKFCRAIMFGGCTDAEALAVIRDRDCAHLGDMIELYDMDELPSDRWFRDAWRRSSNGGPISIDLEKARPIQWRKIIAAVSQENKRRELDLFGLAPIKLPKLTYQNAIRHARDDEELRRIWVPGLSLQPS